jgi:hypothetical protein
MCMDIYYAYIHSENCDRSETKQMAGVPESDYSGLVAYNAVCLRSTCLNPIIVCVGNNWSSGCSNASL